MRINIFGTQKNPKNGGNMRKIEGKVYKKRNK